MEPTIKAYVYKLDPARVSPLSPEFCWRYAVDDGTTWQVGGYYRSQRDAFDKARREVSALRFKAFQDRVSETVRKLADIADYGVPRVVVRTGLPPAPPALVWEGDYA